MIWLTMTTTITKLWGCPQPKNWKIYQLRLRPEILDTCTIGLSVSKECIKIQNGFPYISRNEPTIGSQQNEYKTQLLALLFINLDHESQQLGMSPNSWEFRSDVRELNQVRNQILCLLAKSQYLGVRCQKGLGWTQFSPNILKARFFLYQCCLIKFYVMKKIWPEKKIPHSKKYSICLLIMD